MTTREKLIKRGGIKMDKLQHESDEIKKWDMENVYELADLIADLDREELQQVDLSDLNSTEFDIKLIGHEDFPIWCRDKLGRYLYGENADQIADSDEKMIEIVYG